MIKSFFLAVARPRVSRGSVTMLAASALLIAAAGAWAADTSKTLYDFTAQSGPGTLISDPKGNLYGTTSGGGLSSANCPFNCGVVFELSPAGSGWTYNVLYNFTGGADGGQPRGTLAFDVAGNLYGTTASGGTVNSNCSTGCGTVFELSPSGSSWALSVLHSFDGGEDGTAPSSGVILDANGNLYGTTASGGTGGGGIVFELSPSPSGWIFSTVYNPTWSDGTFLVGGLVLDAMGNLYGTAWTGGISNNCGQGCGTVFELSPSGSGWKFLMLHTFSGPTLGDGALPWGTLIRDSAGDLFGTTSEGGARCGSCAGTVFKLSLSQGVWKETVLHRFRGTSFSDGEAPLAGLTMDGQGNLYGTTNYGGATCADCGTVFKLVPNSKGGWNYRTIYSFSNGADGGRPSGGVVVDTAGHVFATTTSGGSRFSGTVFELVQPANTYGAPAPSSLYSGRVLVGQTSPQPRVNLSNTGGAGLTVGATVNTPTVVPASASTPVTPVGMQNVINAAVTQSPPAVAGSVPVNSPGAFAANSGWTWNNTTNTLSAPNVATTNTLFAGTTLTVGTTSLFTGKGQFNTGFSTPKMNGDVYVDGINIKTLSAALSACPSAPAACRIWVPSNLTFTSPITISAQQPTTIECVGGDVNGNRSGTVLIYSPTTTGTSAITVSNTTRFRIIGCNLTQGNTYANTNGLVLSGAQGGRIEDDQIHGFTGAGLAIEDSPSGSGEQNVCSQSEIGFNGTGLIIQQSYYGKSANQNAFFNCNIHFNSVIQIRLVGNASENAWFDGDISGITNPQVQLGDGTNYCRGNNFFTMTMESSGGIPPANQVGFQNNCMGTFIHAEGGLAGTSPIQIQDGSLSGNCHWYFQSAGNAPHATGSDSTCPPLKWNISGGISTMASNPLNSPSINMPSGWTLASTGNSVAELVNKDFEFLSGVYNDGGGLKHIRGVTGCSTAATVGSTCNTTVTWATAFPDAAYTVTCNGVTPFAGVPVNGGIQGITTSSVQFVTVALTAVPAQFRTIECVAIHD